MAKMKAFNANALEIMRAGLDKGLFNSEADFCDQVGLRPQNLSRIKRADGSFTVEQLITLAKITGASLDTIAGIKPLKQPPRTALSLVAELHEIIKKTPTGK